MFIFTYAFLPNLNQILNLNQKQKSVGVPDCDYRAVLEWQKQVGKCTCKKTLQFILYNYTETQKKEIL